MARGPTFRPKKVEIMGDEQKLPGTLVDFRIGRVAPKSSARVPLAHAFEASDSGQDRCHIGLDIVV